MINDKKTLIMMMIFHAKKNITLVATVPVKLLWQGWRGKGFRCCRKDDKSASKACKKRLSYHTRQYCTMYIHITTETGPIIAINVL